DFYGTFDGKGHVIKNLKIDATGKSNVSLFYSLSYGEIKKLGREGGNTTGDDAFSVSGLIGTIGNKGKLRDCYNSSSISIQRAGGGLVRNASGNDIIIENCYNVGDVIVAGQAAGGLIGTALYGGGSVTIKNCYNVGNLSSPYTSGSFMYALNSSLGFKQVLNMINCFNFGNVVTTTDNNQVGSFIGYTVGTNSVLLEVNATNVYSRPDVASANGVTKSGQPIGWSGTGGENLVNIIIPANPTFGENPKYTLDYSQSAFFSNELGGAFKHAPGRTPKLAWEE
ncbi:MAG: hypothetical protein LBS08_04250, partial [Candidatus Symbiothrix sp.]|nr:hypothetical protein [Candidatus Symbiothrix sp.]